MNTKPRPQLHAVVFLCSGSKRRAHGKAYWLEICFGAGCTPIIFDLELFLHIRIAMCMIIGLGMTSLLSGVPESSSILTSTGSIRCALDM